MRIAVVALVVLTSAAANAKCNFPCSCFEPSGWVVTGPVVTVFDDAGMSSRSMIRVERVFGDPDAALRRSEASSKVAFLKVSSREASQPELSPSSMVVSAATTCASRSKSTRRWCRLGRVRRHWPRAALSSQHATTTASAGAPQSAHSSELSASHSSSCAVVRRGADREASPVAPLPAQG